MDERSGKILGLVVEEYTRTAVPVGSTYLCKQYDLLVSSATVRAIMSSLEDEGYLHQPHTSAGRVPTDKGYRFYIESQMTGQNLSRQDEMELKRELLTLRAKNVRLARTTAKLLSALSGHMVMSGVVDRDEYYDFGLRTLLEDESISSRDELCRVAEVLDYIDERVDVLLAQVPEGETHIFVGKENPLDEISGCSMVVAPYRSKDGERGMVALIGPKRMQYARNKSLVEYVRKFLSGSVIVIFLIVV
ncbi:MAG: hypothetical protein KC736_01370 [Candidatus Moranbacteria bacterium]|nr:hypothetical protein [Candidatus Moranbacteria bacterium]